MSIESTSNPSELESFLCDCHCDALPPLVQVGGELINPAKIARVSFNDAAFTRLDKPARVPCFHLVDGSTVCHDPTIPGDCGDWLISVLVGAARYSAGQKYRQIPKPPPPQWGEYEAVAYVGTADGSILQVTEAGASEVVGGLNNLNFGRVQVSRVTGRIYTAFYDSSVPKIVVKSWLPDGTDPQSQDLNFLIPNAASMKSLG